MNDDSQPSRCGFVALVGRPNVGKSTLLNHMLGQKVSITSRKPQTTRNNVQGIKTENRTQMVFVDTPGLHLGKGRAINRYMNQAASTAIRGVDLVVFLVDRWQWTDEDDMVAERLELLDCPLIIAVNKVDKISQKDQLLPHLAALGERFPQAEIVPLSALRNTNLDRLETLLREHMPEGPHHYPDDQLTDRSARFMASEMVREKLTRQLGDELPHQMAVEIEQFKDEERVLHISALILVERPGQKRILIGESGERIKQIGTQARQDMERLFEKKVMLNLWVKVKSGWSDDNRALRSLGYDD